MQILYIGCMYSFNNSLTIELLKTTAISTKITKILLNLLQFAIFTKKDTSFTKPLFMNLQSLRYFDC